MEGPNTPRTCVTGRWGTAWNRGDILFAAEMCSHVSSIPSSCCKLSQFSIWSLWRHVPEPGTCAGAPHFSCYAPWSFFFLSAGK